MEKTVVKEVIYPIEYVIKEEEGEFILFSVVTRSDTWYGDNHKFKNFVCRGTREFCEEVKERLEGK